MDIDQIEDLIHRWKSEVDNCKCKLWNIEKRKKNLLEEIEIDRSKMVITKLKLELFTEQLDRYMKICG